MLILQKMPISAELALPTFELLLPTFWGSNPRICWNFSRVPGSVERTCVTSVSQGSWRKYMPTHSDNNLCLSRRYRKIWGKFRLVWRVGFHIVDFEACSVFAHAAARMAHCPP